MINIEIKDKRLLSINVDRVVKTQGNCFLRQKRWFISQTFVDMEHIPKQLMKFWGPNLRSRQNITL